MSARHLVRGGVAAGLLASVLGLGLPAAAAGQSDGPAAQAPQPPSELERLRQANLLEAGGDLAGAERMVREILDANPASLTALIALERLLGAQGRVADVLPAAERLIRADPGSALGHRVRLRVLARTGTTRQVEAAVADWTRATPAVETPWREAAVVWRERGDAKRAIAILESGRRHVTRDDALALELGDAHLAAGDLRRAATEWARAVGSDGRGFMLVQRRLHDLPDGGARLIPLLVPPLADAPRTTGRLRAAVLLAVEGRLDDAARRHAGTLLEAVPPDDRETTLAELARRSDHAGMHTFAAWAYGELLRLAVDPAATLALRTRVAELALLAGDTARAADAWGELERAAEPGSPQRRQAAALRIQLAAREGDLHRATDLLREFRSEFPGAAELDMAAATVATAILAARAAPASRAADAAATHGAAAVDAGADGAHGEDHDSLAAAVLAGVHGARSAQLRGRIALRAGDLATARDELLAAAAQLRGADATETLALAALLMRLSPRGGALVSRYVGARNEEREHLVRDAIDRTDGLAATERAAILDFVAALADRAGLAEDADALRHEIVDALPRSHEAAGALLALARRALADADGEEQARLLLERLILEHPRSTLAPQARQALQRLQRNVSAQ